MTAFDPDSLQIPELLDESELREVAVQATAVEEVSFEDWIALRTEAESDDYIDEDSIQSARCDSITDEWETDPFVLVSRMERERGYPLACDAPVLRS